jgi:purine catabolism regulator
MEVGLMLTLEKALLLDVFKNAVVLSGEQGLKNEIGSVNVMEVPDISDWVPPGELILTTGYPFKDAPVQFVSLISKLSEKRLSGIAIKTKRFIDELPEEVLQKADELGFPLIQLPSDARFSNIISGISAHVANRDYVNIKKSMEIQHNISNLIIAGGQFQEIALFLSKAFNCKVEILDAFGNLLAESLEHIQMPNKLDPRIYFYEKELRISNEIAGYIKLMSHTKMFDKDEILIIDNTAKSLAVSMIKHKTIKEKERAQKIEFLNELAFGRFTSKNTMLERANKLKINMHMPYIAYTASVGYKAEQRIPDESFEMLISDYINSLNLHCLCWTESKGKTNIFISVSPNIEDRKACSIDIGQLLNNYLSKEIKDICIKIGIGTYHEDNINLHKSFSEALQAMQIGSMLAKDTGVYHYSDIGIYQILLPMVGTELATRYVDSFIGKLIEHDKKKKSQLVFTLEQTIKCDSLEEAAGRLFVHPKTLALRKTKIEKILGISLKSEETKLALLAAIMLNKIN